MIINELIDLIYDTHLIGDVNITDEVKEEVFEHIQFNFEENEDVDVQTISNSIEEGHFEMAGSLVDPYTASLLKWYSEDLDRIYYMNELIEDAADIFDLLMAGQLQYYLEQFQALTNYIGELES